MSIHLPAPRRRWAAPLLVWAAAAVALAMLDGTLDVGNLALLLVLASAVASFWLVPWLSVPACAVAVMAFNWAFVPPRHSFSVELWPHAWLLLTMLVVNTGIALVVARLQASTLRERRQTARVRQLQELGEALRDAEDAAAAAGALFDALKPLAGGAVALLLLRDELPRANDDDAVIGLGTTDADTRAGLWLSLRSAAAMGPGTGRHQELGGWILPLRGRAGAQGAAWIELAEPPPDPEDSLDHAQALCDQTGLALERAAALRDAARAQTDAQAQRLRNTLLAAISHDYRTPLANLMGAASSLHDQGDRLAPEQRRRLAATIVDEAAQLARLTDNTLQLVRLDAPGVELRLEWESAEEIVGSALRHARQRDATRRVRARIDPGVPLLRCDAVLLLQMLDNLVDNALKYSPPESPVEILVRVVGGRLLLAVRDRGPGVPPALRERIFEVFQRGTATAEPTRGAGVGLAVCRAIARAHGGALTLRARGHGGSAFECWLPLSPAPPAEAPR